MKHLFFSLENKFILFNEDYLEAKSDKFFKRASIFPSLEFIIEENSSFWVLA